MIIISSGRRIDAFDATEERFPLSNVERVAEEVQSRLELLGASMLICSAACGADLIVLDAARKLNIRSRIVLPFAPERFRKSSVVDRPGNLTWNWGALFDELIKQAKDTNDLIVLSPEGTATDDDTAAYVATNQRLIVEALNLSRDVTHHQRTAIKEQLRAIIIWEGATRGEDDLTAEFANRARQNGIPIEEVKTSC